MSEKCPNCGAKPPVLEYTNCYDEETQLIIYECHRCGHIFVPREELVDITSPKVF